jgi:hypothetical protein
MTAAFEDRLILVIGRLADLITGFAESEHQCLYLAVISLIPSSDAAILRPEHIL